MSDTQDTYAGSSLKKRKVAISASDLDHQLGTSSSVSSPPASHRRASRPVSQKDSSDRRRRPIQSVSEPTIPTLLSRRTRWRRWFSKWEVARKVLHTSIGFITLHRWIRSDGSPNRILLGLGKALVVIVSADLLRFRSARFAKFYEQVLGFLMRPAERTNWNGVIFYLIGVIISMTTLPLDISVLSILTLSWVDTAASVVGRLYGSDTARLPSPPFARRKSLAGFLGALAVGTTTALAFWSSWAGMGLSGSDGYSWQLVATARSGFRNPLDDSWLSALMSRIQLPNPQSRLGLGPLSIGCGLVAALAESLDVFGWDDNLVLPVLSGWGIWGLMKTFG